MKRWRRRFYQEYFLTYPSMIRECEVVLEEYENPKNGLYNARVVEINILENWRGGTVVGGCFYKYQIGEVFKIRQHKRHFFFKNPLWFDARFPGKEGFEDFHEII